MLIPTSAHADTQAGLEWTQQTAAVDRPWQAVAFGNGLFVALANNDSTNKVMTSPDGVTWTAQPVTDDVYWRSIVYGNGLFVAVGAQNAFGTDSQAMSSPDGITWTPAATPPPAREWMSVAYGAGLFVAVAKGGYVMRSADGSNWIESVIANQWSGITYAAGQFVAVAQSGTNRVMTSPDGVTWTPRAAASVSNWVSITYGNGTYVATAWTGADRVMTSPDGVTWTAQSATSTTSEWLSVTFGAGIFVAVSINAPDRVMTSPDGVTWTARNAASANQWMGVTFGNNTFVAVAVFAGFDGVMSSSGSISPLPSVTPDVPTFSLSFDSMPGVEITGGIGSWVTLPIPNNPPASSPNSTFLGWATYEGFPIEIAQRQIDNGWGAYEVFAGNGSLRGVFIPAGGSARIAAPEGLYPVWS